MYNLRVKLFQYRCVLSLSRVEKEGEMGGAVKDLPLHHCLHPAVPRCRLLFAPLAATPSPHRGGGNAKPKRGA